MNRDDGDVLLSRRRWLARLGAAAGTAALAGCSDDPDVTTTRRSTRTTTAERPPETGTTEPPAETTVADPTDLDRYELSFDRVVNLKRKGADATGGSPIDDLLEEYAGDHTLIFLPRGRYRMDRGLKLSSFTNFGIVGPRATVLPPAGDGKYMFVFGTDPPGDARGLLFEGITFDFRAPNTGPLALNVLVDDEVYVRDLTIRGQQAADQPAIGMAITKKGGSGIVERARLPDGGPAGTTPVGIFVHKMHLGEVTFRDCQVENFPNNGIYASRGKGPVKVEGGRYRNNDISQVRLSSAGSYAKGVDIVVDETRKRDRNQRGIWLRNPDGVLVEDCRVRLQRSVGSSAIEVYRGSGATFRNCDVEVNASRYAFLLEGGDAKKRGNVLLENVAVTGTASGDRFPYAIECRRDGCVFRNVTVDQTGSNRHGLWIRGKNCAIEGGSWVASRRPIAVSLSRVGDGDCLLHIDGIERLRATAVKDPGTALRLSGSGDAGFGADRSGGYCIGGDIVDEMLDRTGGSMVVINGVNSDGAVGRVVPR